MKWPAVLLLSLAACARQVGMGEPCEETQQCGKGGDCYQHICTPLCADDSECDGELVCARHHCLLATGEPRQKPSAKLPDDAPRPGLRNAPADESTAGVSQQLEDLRKDLESIRKEQQRLREAIETLQKRP